MTIRQGFAFLICWALFLVAFGAVLGQHGNGVAKDTEVRFEQPMARCSSDAECIEMFGPEEGQ
jgi:hypothetical protein